jgi:sodium/potassium-transporting ATPase subunit alpha
VWIDGYKGLDQDKLNEVIKQGQTVTYVSLVMMQIFGNVLSTRTHVRSFFSTVPFFKPNRNIWIFLAQTSSMILLLITVYVPFFNNLFCTRPIPIEFFMLPVACSILMFSLDELRKLCVRRKFLFFHKVGW